MMSRADAGFSLVEILVGLFVFALAASMAVAMLAATVDGEAGNRAALERIEALDRIRTVLRDDLGQVVERPVRDADGYVREYLFAGAENGVPLRAGQDRNDRLLLSFTRRGRANPGALQPRSSLVFVEYRLRDDRLVRVVARHPDLARADDVQEMVLVEDIADLDLEFFYGSGWTREVLIPVSGDELSLPEAVRLRYDAPVFGRVEHVVLTAGAS